MIPAQYPPPMHPHHGPLPSASHPQFQQSQQTQQPVADTNTIRCLCNFSDDDGETIFCDQCGFWQHMSCVGLANKAKEDLPESWYCWNCKPDKFEWVQSLNGGGSGDTLATSLGISQSHWNPNYVASSSGLGLDIGNGASGPMATPHRTSSSSLRISNLLSPAPPPPLPPKILLDPVKARKRQEARRVEEERLKKHQRDVHAANGVVGQNANANGRTEAGPAHVRKASVAQGDKPKGRKVNPNLQAAAAVAARGGGAAGGLVADGQLSAPGPSTAPSTTNAAQRTVAAVPSTSNAVAAATAVPAKRKPSSAAATKARNKEKDLNHQPKLAIPESSPRFPPTAPLPTSTPRTAHLTFAQPKSPKLPSGAPLSASYRARSRSVDPNGVVPNENGDVDMDEPFRPPNGLPEGAASDADDYFSVVGKGKGKEREVYPISPMAREGPVMTPYASTPFLANNHRPHTTPGGPPHVLQSPVAPPVYHPRPPHPLITSLGTGVKVAVSKGVSTGSALSRPQPLTIRSFIAASDPSSSSNGSSSGLSLFLDPRPPLPRSPSLNPTRQPLSPLSNNVLPPATPRGPTIDRSTRSPSLSALNLPNFPLDPFSPSGLSVDARRLPSDGPNAVVRPLLCGERSRRGSSLEDTIQFGVFLVREMAAGEAISLGWEMRESLQKSTHEPNTIAYIADTFITCGSCGRKTNDCLVDVMKAVEANKENPAMDLNSEETMHHDDARPHGKRPRSPGDEMDVDRQADEIGTSDRPAKRARLDDDQHTTPVPTADTPLATPSTAVPSDRMSPEITVGLDVSLRRLKLEAGAPALPSPKARFRFSWKQQLEKSQADFSSATSAPRVPIGLGLTSYGPGSRLQISPLAVTAAHTAQTSSTSPLTEPSVSIEDDESVVVAKRINRARINSTPPSEEVTTRSTPQVDIPPPPAPAKKAGPLPEHQRGPPRFRKWAPNAPRVHVAPAPTPVLATDVKDTPEVPQEGLTSIDEDGDANMAGPVSMPPPPPTPPRPASMAAFSIRSLLNPAPTPSKPPPAPPPPPREPSAPPKEPSPSPVAESEALPTAEPEQDTLPSAPDPISTVVELVHSAPQTPIIAVTPAVEQVVLMSPPPAPSLSLAILPLTPNPLHNFAPRPSGIDTPSRLVPLVEVPIPVTPPVEDSSFAEEVHPPVDEEQEKQAPLPPLSLVLPATEDVQMQEKEEEPAAQPEQPKEKDDIEDIVMEMEMESAAKASVASNTVDDVLASLIADEGLPTPAAERTKRIASMTSSAMSSPITPAPDIEMPLPEEPESAQPAMEVDVVPPSSPLSSPPPEVKEIEPEEPTPRPREPTPLPEPAPIIEAPPAPQVVVSAESESADPVVLVNGQTSLEPPATGVPDTPKSTIAEPQLLLPVPTANDAEGTPGSPSLEAASPAPSSAANHTPQAPVRKMTFADYAKAKKAKMAKEKKKVAPDAEEHAAGGALNLVLEGTEDGTKKQDDNVPVAPALATPFSAPPVTEAAASSPVVPPVETIASTPSVQAPLPEVSSAVHSPVVQQVTTSPSIPTFGASVPEPPAAANPALPPTPVVQEAPLVLPTVPSVAVDTPEGPQSSPAEVQMPLPEPREQVKMEVQLEQATQESNPAPVKEPTPAPASPVFERKATPVLIPATLPRAQSPAPPQAQVPQKRKSPEAHEPRKSSPAPRQATHTPEREDDPVGSHPNSPVNHQTLRSPTASTSERRQASPAKDSPAEESAKSPRSPVQERKSLWSRLHIPEPSTGPTITDHSANDIARKLQMQATAAGKDRYNPSPPPASSSSANASASLPPSGPSSLPRKVPPTEPRSHVRSGLPPPPSNVPTAPPAEEGEIMSSPTASPAPPTPRRPGGPPSTPLPPTQPRFHRPTSPRGRPPPLGPRAGLPSAPRAMAANGPPPRGPSRPPPPGGWDDRDRDRDWDRDGRDRDRDRDRDPRDRDWDRDRRRPWRGGRGRPWGR